MRTSAQNSLTLDCNILVTIASSSLSENYRAEIPLLGHQLCTRIFSSRLDWPSVKKATVRLANQVKGIETLSRNSLSPSPGAIVGSPEQRSRRCFSSQTLLTGVDLQGILQVMPLVWTLLNQ